MLMTEANYGIHRASGLGALAGTTWPGTSSVECENVLIVSPVLSSDIPTSGATYMQ